MKRLFFFLAILALLISPALAYEGMSYGVAVSGTATGQFYTGECVVSAAQFTGTTGDYFDIYDGTGAAASTGTWKARVWPNTHITFPIGIKLQVGAWGVVSGSDTKQAIYLEK